MSSSAKIGLGCVTFGREIDETASFALMDHAHARGVQFFDTAANYAKGASELIVGKWLASRRPAPGSLTVATKIYPPYTPAQIKEAIGRSMERLGTTALDVLFLHKWDETADTPEAMVTLHAAVESGLVRRLGVSNFDLAQLSKVLGRQASLKLHRFQFLQNNHNVAVRSVDVPLRELCAAEGIAIVTYSPLGAGFLTGKHKAGVEPGSRFDVMPGHQRIYFTESAMARLARLEAVAGKSGYTLTQLALGWALHHPGVATVLVGGRTPRHLDQAFEALAIERPDLYAELSAV